MFTRLAADAIGSPLDRVTDRFVNRNDRYPKVMVVHLTTRDRAGEPYDWEVALPRGAGGLRYASVAKCGEI